MINGIKYIFLIQSTIVPYVLKLQFIVLRNLSKKVIEKVFVL